MKVNECYIHVYQVTTQGLLIDPIRYIMMSTHELIILG